MIVLLYNTHMKELAAYKQGKWLVAVSGGADSMALLDLCVKEGMQVSAAHMNYRKRDTADRDMKCVEDYCQRHGIPFFCTYQTKAVTGNFQAFARKERYDFFYRVIKEQGLDGVLVAHHLDDYIETYLMQKQRNGIVSYLGISREIEIQKCRVIRPLLKQTKEELRLYCQKEEVEFYDDESNFTDDYTRNRIRHQQIERMSKEEKLQLYEEAERENEKRLELKKQVEDLFNQGRWQCKEIFAWEEEIQRAYLFAWIQKYAKQTMSQAMYEHIQSRKDKKNWKLDLGNGTMLYEEYGYLWVDDGKDVSYAYEITSIQTQEFETFKLAKAGKVIEGITLYESDFPLIVRSPKPQDAIELRFGTKKVNRWFIDRKIPKKERKTWPVVENAQGKVIFVAKIGCDVEHFSNNPDLFVIKY